MDVRNKTLWILRDYVYILIGAAITAVSFNVFCFRIRLPPAGQRDQYDFTIIWF